MGLAKGPERDGTNMFSRPPCFALVPFVQTLWVNESIRASCATEYVLPTGAVHMVISFAPQRPSILTPRGAQEIPVATVGGPRDQSYGRLVPTVSHSIGVQFHAGAAQAFFGNVGDLTAAHHDLRDLWGREADDLVDRLARCTTRHAQLDEVEAALLRRLRGFAHFCRVRHAAQQLERLPVRHVAAEVNMSHRHFVAVFKEATGLSPKVYARVRRVQAVLDRIASAPMAQVAADVGFSDQAHMSREFGRVVGVSPTQYLAVAPTAPNHLSWKVNFLQDDE
ncbi:MAG: helix-turn-helix domain-containing protein [bacterium]